MLIGFIVLIVLQNRQSSGGEGNQNDKGETIIINSGGEAVEVNNFYNDTLEVHDSTYYLSQESTYTIFFDKLKNSFIITLFVTEVDNGNDIRYRAEEELMKKLGISRGEACLLQIEVGVPFSSSPNLSGINYGLSFCPPYATIPNEPIVEPARGIEIR